MAEALRVGSASRSSAIVPRPGAATDVLLRPAQAPGHARDDLDPGAGEIGLARRGGQGDTITVLA